LKLTAKIAVALIAGICVVLFLNAKAQIEEINQRYARDMQEDALDVGRLFRPMVARAWRTEGQASALYLIRYTNETLKTENVSTRMNLRWVWLDEAGNGQSRPRVPLSELRAVKQGQEVSILAPGEGGATWRYSYIPVEIGIDGERPGALEVTESTEPLRAYAQAAEDRLWKTTAWLAALGAAFVLAVGSWFVARPLQTLANAAEAIGRGDLAVRVHLKQRDEVGKLAQAMNAMAERLARARAEIAVQHEQKLKAVEQLRHADRLSSVGAFASGIAHELGTPLAVVSGRAKLIADGIARGDQIAQYAEIIDRQVTKMTDIIGKLLDFARRGTLRIETHAVAGVIEPVLELIRPLGHEQLIGIELRAPTAPLLVKGDKTLLEQVVTNLVVNAVDAMPKGGTIIVSAESTVARPPAHLGGPEGRFVCCRVHDQGEGIRPDVMSRIFEPFFTTKGVGKGTGLGLAVSYGIVTEHGGWIDVHTSVGRGSCFSVYLPASDEQPYPDESS
jgi:two-component system, NtrC family, sensor kinase